jgi:hypothetical protein
MEGAMRGAMEKYFRYYSDMTGCSELKFCTKVNDGEIVDHQ